MTVHINGRPVGVQHGVVVRIGGGAVVSPDEKSIVNRLGGIADLRQHLVDLLTETRDTLHAAELASKRAADERADVDLIIAERTKAFPWLADAIAQYHELRDQRIADFLELKLRPGVAAAARVREIAREKREVQQKFRLARNRVRYYEKLFPWLRDFVDDDIDDLIAAIGRTDGDGDRDADPVLKWLAPGEQQLATADRNQRALDRWWSSRKRKWQIGRDYERFVGYLYESDGYRVQYFGATQGVADLGRDLIAERDDEVLIVQCKYWREERTVREKHIFQLFGTAVEHWLRCNDENRVEAMGTLFESRGAFVGVHPVLVTTAEFSAEAVEFADRLGVRLRSRIEFDRSYPSGRRQIS